MDPGKLNRRITIQAPAAGQDALGQPSVVWANVFSTPDGKIAAAINPISARELFAAQAVQSETSHKITVRYRVQFENPKTVAGMRAVYGARIFNISGAINLNENNKFVDLLCSEGLNNG